MYTVKLGMIKLAILKLINMINNFYNKKCTNIAAPLVLHPWLQKSWRRSPNIDRATDRRPTYLGH